MYRYIFPVLLLAFISGDAAAQTKPARRATRKKTALYSPRRTRRAPSINPHTGKPYGAGVSQDLKDGNYYLAPSMAMRKQVGYSGNGGYNDNRTRRASGKKPTNTSLSRDNSTPTAASAKK
ncbi:hypothetical protein IC235_03830 [Hymenobacter sp. BT664]|uniref:PBCV-specific basic adaptor domain-containing protein n=1 Tax=Hymenobacter montanus TaxID=2771359 RepID=A0A927GI49_9BACT|nr:hypothetical protein [Hymenobacter montanus]MBD2767022.1 hypothetical protein [Hymenobacter montanus]